MSADLVTVAPDDLSTLTDDALTDAFDRTRAATMKGLTLRFGIDSDEALDVVHRALVRFLADTSDEDIHALGVRS